MRKIKYKAVFGVLVLFAGYVFATNQLVSVGASFSGFLKEERGQRTIIGQFVSPWSYLYAHERFTGFISSGLASSLPYKVSGEEFFGSRFSMADTRLGFMMPIIQNRLMGSVSFLMPVGLKKLYMGELLAEQALADTDFRFSQSRFRDGSKINASIAYAQKIGEVLGTASAGYFRNSEFDKLKPGDICMVGVGAGLPLSQGILLRNDLSYSHNFPTYAGGIEASVQGNALSYMGSLAKKVGRKREMKLGWYANANGRNSQSGQLEEANSNRNSFGIQFSYDLKSEGVMLTPIVGLDQYFSNGYDANKGDDLDEKHKPSQTRAELGFRISRPLSEIVKISGKTSIYAGNHDLIGGIMAATLTWGATQ